MRFDFEKYEGLGNDFIVMDVHPEMVAPHVRRLCDRHFGVGADGVLVVAPPKCAESRATMVVLNADGSRPEMCGNGLRCVALHLARRDRAAAISYVVDTDAGPLSCEVDKTEERSASVRTSLGRGQNLGSHKVQLDGEDLDFLRVSMGNPHAIRFGAIPPLSVIDAWSERISGGFSEGSNVEFADRVEPGVFELVVWERGVGRTLACGTGAAATAVAAVQTGREAHGKPIQMRLPGGILELWVDEDLMVTAQGPARFVFSGSVEVP